MIFSLKNLLLLLSKFQISFVFQYFVFQFDLRSNSATKLFYCSSFTELNRQSRNNISLNAIVIDPRNPNYFAVGGSDEYARVYDIRKHQCDSSNNLDGPVNTFCPHHLVGADVHITGLAYSNTSELLVSYNDELIYLFQKNMGMGPTPLSVPPEELQKLEKPQVYLGHRNSQTVKSVSFFGPTDDYVLSGSDCGHIFVWKKKGAKLVRLTAGDQQIVNHLEPHPYMPIFASCGIENSIKLWIPMADGSLPLPDDAEKVLSQAAIFPFWWEKRKLIYHFMSLLIDATLFPCLLSLIFWVVYEQIMESNRQGREDHSLITLTPDVIMHVLRLQRRQNAAYIERRYDRADIENDEEDEGEAYLLGFSDGEASSEEGFTGNTAECNIS